MFVFVCVYRFFLYVCVCLCIICFFPSNVNSTVYTLMYVHIFGYLVNKLEIWWVYLSPIESKTGNKQRTAAFSRIYVFTLIG